jgi:hypothetical protein
MYRYLGINDSMKLEQHRRPMTRETVDANLKYPTPRSVSSPTALGIRSPGGSGHYSMP